LDQSYRAWLQVLFRYVSRDNQLEEKKTELQKCNEELKATEHTLERCKKTLKEFEMELGKLKECIKKSKHPKPTSSGSCTKIHQVRFQANFGCGILGHSALQCIQVTTVNCDKL